MLNFSKFFNKKNNSSDVAKNRLKLVLIQDKDRLNSTILKKIKEEFIKILLKYTDVKEEDLDIHIATSEGKDGKISALNANVPIAIRSDQEQIG